MDNLAQVILTVISLFITISVGIVVYDQYKEQTRKWGENE